MSSWVHVEDDGKHSVYRCWSCRALGVTLLGCGNLLGKCYKCASGAPTGKRR